MKFNVIGIVKRQIEKEKLCIDKNTLIVKSESGKYYAANYELSAEMFTDLVSTKFIVDYSGRKRKYSL